jgi:UDP-N-acetylglucosamine 2-epimerase (non-hydrolysing)
VEAGLRSGDMRMPEEINRIVTDSISDLLFVTEPSGIENLKREGKPDSAVHYVGHVMIDNLFYQRDKLEKSDASSYKSAALKGAYARYGIVTLHRPALVDTPAAFKDVVGALRTISKELPLIFPMHPRTKANAQKFGIEFGLAVTVTEPLSYMDFLNLWKDAALVLTDSGGLQEETTALGVPCLTLRDNTERPITISEGTNVLVGMQPARILEETTKILGGEVKAGRRPHLWDGHAAERIVDILLRHFSKPTFAEAA